MPELIDETARQNARVNFKSNDRWYASPQQYRRYQKLKKQNNERKIDEKKAHS
jgi:hypothetical protein